MYSIFLSSDRSLSTLFDLCEGGTANATPGMTVTGPDSDRLHSRTDSRLHTSSGLWCLYDRADELLPLLQLQLAFLALAFPPFRSPALLFGELSQLVTVLLRLIPRPCQSVILLQPRMPIRSHCSFSSSSTACHRDLPKIWF